MRAFTTILAALSFTLGLVAQNDSITTLDEVILIERGIQKMALGITPSNRLEPVEMERFGPLELAATMNQISGVYMLSGALNTNRITIRGVGARTPFSTNKLRMYFNNIPITNGTGTSELEAYDLQNLGSIEVIKGPKGSSYGGNLGGAIVLSTKAPIIERTLLRNTFSVGSYGMLKNNLSFSHSEKNMNINLSYNHLEIDGYRDNNRFERDGLLLTTAFRLGAASKLDLMVNHIDYTAQIASSINATDFGEDPTRAAGNWLAAQGFEANNYTLAGLTYTQEIGDYLTGKTSVFYTYLDHYEPRPFNILDEFTNGFGFRTEWNGTWEKWTYGFGAENYRDEYQWGTFENNYQENNGQGSLLGNQLSDNKEFRDQLNLFMHIGYPIAPNLTAQFGLNFNATRWDFRDRFNSGTNNASAKRDFDGLLLPNLGLAYSFEHGRLYANLSRGFSNPSLEETLTPDGIINPDIRQETGINYELGGQWTFLGERLRINATLYRMDIENLLVAERVGEDQFIGRNAGATRHQGLELDARYQLPIARTWEMTPYLSYTLNDHSFVDFVDGGTDYSGNPLTGVPKNRLNGGITWSNGRGFSLLTTYQFVDGIPLTDANNLSSEAFSLFNAQVQYEVSLSPSLKARLDLGMNNILNTRYAQSVLINAVGFGGSEPRFFYPGNNRNLYGGLQLSYTL